MPASVQIRNRAIHRSAVGHDVHKSIIVHIHEIKEFHPTVSILDPLSETLGGIRELSVVPLKQNLKSSLIVFGVCLGKYEIQPPVIVQISGFDIIRNRQLAKQPVCQFSSQAVAALLGVKAENACRRSSVATNNQIHLSVGIKIDQMG